MGGSAMKRISLVFLALLAMGVSAHAQIGPGGCTALAPCTVTTTPAPYEGNGTLATSTSSALINTMTVSAGSAALPSTLTAMTAINLGTTDAALCPNTTSAGATCTCPENGVATTNGITLLAGGGGYIFTLSIASTAPTIVACSGTPPVQFQW